MHFCFSSLDIIPPSVHYMEFNIFQWQKPVGKDLKTVGIDHETDTKGNFFMLILISYTNDEVLSQEPIPTRKI